MALLSCAARSQPSKTDSTLLPNAQLRLALQQIEAGRLAMGQVEVQRRMIGLLELRLAQRDSALALYAGRDATWSALRANFNQALALDRSRMEAQSREIAQLQRRLRTARRATLIGAGTLASAFVFKLLKRSL